MLIGWIVIDLQDGDIPVDTPATSGDASAKNLIADMSGVRKSQANLAAIGLSILGQIRCFSDDMGAGGDETARQQQRRTR